MLNINGILNKEKIIEKFRFFFGEITWKKSLTFLFFLFLAIIFWIVQTYSNKMQMKLSLPIHYTNMTDSVVFERELPTEIDVYIKDYGSAYLKYLTRKEDSIYIDLAPIIEEGSASRKLLQGQEFEQLVKTKLLPSSDLTSFTPSYISFAFNVVSVKKLPVVFDGLANLAVGYQLDGDITLTPDSVIALSSKNVLDTIKYAYTVRDTLNIDGNKNIKIKLRPTKGVYFKPDEIILNVPVDEFKEREVNVPVKCVNLPKDLDIKFFPPSVKINFFIGSKRSNLIESSDFQVIVDYLDIKERELNSIPIRVIEYPDYIRIRSLEPSEVEYILEQQ